MFGDEPFRLVGGVLEGEARRLEVGAALEAGELLRSTPKMGRGRVRVLDLECHGSHGLRIAPTEYESSKKAGGPYQSEAPPKPPNPIGAGPWKTSQKRRAPHFRHHGASRPVRVASHRTEAPHCGQARRKSVGAGAGA